MSKHGPRGRGDVTRFWPEARRKRSSWARFVPLWAGAALAGTAYGAGWVGAVCRRSRAASTPATQPIRASFGYCHTGGGTNCVVDGDTIWLGGAEDPRRRHRRARDPSSALLRAKRSSATAATRRLQQLLNGGAVSLAAIDRDQDRYGRKLRIVLVDGRSVGDRLVDEGLARYYAGGRKPWC